MLPDSRRPRRLAAVDEDDRQARQLDACTAPMAGKADARLAMAEAVETATVMT